MYPLRTFRSETGASSGDVDLTIIHYRFPQSNACFYPIRAEASYEAILHCSGKMGDLYERPLTLAAPSEHERDEI
ncbi:jg15726 [Pararge aegeria aegeria]|uniref:Jg15726 protein n=1 Tax=Pararge aegeria aegeria TaxID=348720 RepID=A0A8S4SJU3_9NEOP|nr:jg15726 [Pararge aegeria aegeria]